jgi:hypothetical protein
VEPPAPPAEVVVAVSVVPPVPELEAAVELVVPVVLPLPPQLASAIAPQIRDAVQIDREELRMTNLGWGYPG